MKSLSECEVRSALPPHLLFEEVRQFISGPSWRSATADGTEDVAADPANDADAASSTDPWRPAFKAGRLGMSAGLRLRPYSEGHYVTVYWDNPSVQPTVVESTWLTYMRTAALLLLGPWASSTSHSESSIVVYGRGRLGIAVLELATAVLPGASLTSWAPSDRNRPRVDALDNVACVTGHAPPVATVTVFATSAATLLPLTPSAHRSCTWLCFGGPLKSSAAQLPDALIAHRDHWTDEPLRCRTLQLSPRARSLAELVDSPRSARFNARNPLGPSSRDGHVVWVCGGGPIDVHLAQAAIKRSSMVAVSEDDLTYGDRE